MSTGIIKLSGLIFSDVVIIFGYWISSGIVIGMSWEGISDSAIEFLRLSDRDFVVFMTRSDCSSQSLLADTLNPCAIFFTLTDNIGSRLEAAESNPPEVLSDVLLSCLMWTISAFFIITDSGGVRGSSIKFRGDERIDPSSLLTVTYG